MDEAGVQTSALHDSRGGRGAYADVEKREERVRFDSVNARSCRQHVFRPRRWMGKLQRRPTAEGRTWRAKSPPKGPRTSPPILRIRRPKHQDQDRHPRQPKSNAPMLASWRNSISLQRPGLGLPLEYHSVQPDRNTADLDAQSDLPDACAPGRSAPRVRLQCEP